MLRPSDLAEMADFDLGPVVVSPSRRVISWGDAHSSLEPRSMQVLVLLSAKLGEVVTRQHLFEEVWGGTPVGDDSLNRAIAGVRKALEIAPGAFEIETIPRTGYRLIQFVEQQSMKRDVVSAGIDRRVVIGGIGAIAVSGASWFAVSKRQSSNKRLVEEHIEEGLDILRLSLPRTEDKAVAAFLEATRLDPGNSRAWGLLALAHRGRVEYGKPEIVTDAVQATNRAAKRALQLDPNDGNALTALATVVPEFGNWGKTEKQLRIALKRAPDSFAPNNAMALLMQAVGRAKEGFEFNNRSIELDPLHVAPQYRSALKNWIIGRIDVADQVLTRALATWPKHPIFWNTRVMTYCFSGRPRAASNFIGTAPRPDGQTDEFREHWSMIIEGLETEEPDERRAVARSIVQMATTSPVYATHAIMALSEMGEVDHAFALMQAYYLGENELGVVSEKDPDQRPINDLTWRRTMALFTPATLAVRKDRRFMQFAGQIGLTEYWKLTGTGPDPFLFD